MPIRFSVELTDPHTEALLIFLEDQLGDNEAHKLSVLSCARQWLELHAPTAFNRGDAHEKSSLVVETDESVLDASSPAQTQPQHRQA